MVTAEQETKLTLTLGFDRYPLPNLAGEFTPAPDLEALAKRLIDEKFPDFPECSIEFLWKASGGKTNGKVKLGMTTKTSGLTGYFSKVDFVTWLAADHVYELRMTRTQVEAALYHELCHIEGPADGEEGDLSLRAHDFEGFKSEIREYGFWRTDAADMGVAVQARLALEDPAESKRAILARLQEPEESSEDELELLLNPEADGFTAATLEESDEDESEEAEVETPTRQRRQRNQSS